MSSITPTLRRAPVRLLLGGMLALAIVLILSGSAFAQPAYHIVNQYSGKVLMPAGGSTAWGTPIYQRGTDGSAAQHWFFNYEGAGRYSFKNRASKLCIHPSNWQPVSGAYLLQASCVTTNGARMWYPLYSSASGTYTFRSGKSGLYMDIEGSSTLTNALAVQATFDGSTSQRWRLRYVGNY